MPPGVVTCLKNKKTPSLRNLHSVILTLPDEKTLK